MRLFVEDENLFGNLCRLPDNSEIEHARRHGRTLSGDSKLSLLWPANKKPPDGPAAALVVYFSARLVAVIVPTAVQVVMARRGVEMVAMPLDRRRVIIEVGRVVVVEMAAAKTAASV